MQCAWASESSSELVMPLTTILTTDFCVGTRSRNSAKDQVYQYRTSENEAAREPSQRRRRRSTAVRESPPASPAKMDSTPARASERITECIAAKSVCVHYILHFVSPNSAQYCSRKYKTFTVSKSLSAAMRTCALGSGSRLSNILATRVSTISVVSTF